MLKIHAESDYIKIWADVLSVGLYKSVLSVVRENCDKYFESLDGVIEVFNPSYTLIYELSVVIDLVID